MSNRHKYLCLCVLGNASETIEFLEAPRGEHSRTYTFKVRQLMVSTYFICIGFYQAYVHRAYVEPGLTSFCIGLYVLVVPVSMACRPGTTNTYGMVVQHLRSV